MFLTRIKLNPKLEKTQVGFASPNLFHGAIEWAFKDKQDRNLWRIDRIAGQDYLMLLSKDKPCMDNVIEQFGFKGDNPEMKEYDILLDKLRSGQKWRFRLVANPTRKTKNNEGKEYISAHVSERFQIEWLKHQADKYGFIVDNVVVTGTDWKSFKKGKEKMHVTLKQVTFEGVLTIDDLEKFKTALVNGIGRGKAYGNGMLTVVRI